MSCVHEGRSLRASLLAGVFLLVLLCAGTPVAHAQQRALSVTVTPPLFQLTIGPGESWSSTVKIVNDNQYDVSYYANVMDFAAQGEDGQAKFVPLVAETGDPARANFSLASWLSISPGPYFIKAGASQEIPFSVQVPENAEPGGHYASILVGTEPTDQASAGTSMKISSFVSSLLFVKIKGDIVEKGRIREFRSENTVYQTPDADFLLRFENLGNTHLKPQGDVTIYNMWGKERGRIDINQKGNFGNVLPKSIRRFGFSWTGESSVFDVGRYSAVVTLAFGQDYKQNVTAVTYFWVVPAVPMAITFAVVALFVALITWMIRRYIRRALELERVRAGYAPVEEYRYEDVASVEAAPLVAPKAAAPSMEALIEPFKEGVIDLRRLSGGKAVSVEVSARGDNQADIVSHESTMTVGRFISKYKLFFLFVLVVLVALVGVRTYFVRALVPTRGFQITDVQVREESANEASTSVQR